ncbi:hypothetical protein BT67DRAFT_222626 [Trichocladium antarcticum]|uniref:Uncharacterized protein n=1 Tax=Trichocladium antarcticum TaxID=1450529 RepID=A0AAN6ZAK7_9PEZI|nr:hypothetical protein BT67DRAFT_222626 [Trichocladium antarcticum]
MAPPLGMLSLTPTGPSLLATGGLNICELCTALQDACKESDHQARTPGGSLLCYAIDVNKLQHSSTHKPGVSLASQF